MKAPPKEVISVPISVFKNDYLSALEVIVKYLRENMQLSFKEIAKLTGRNEIPLAITCRNAKVKMPEFLIEKPTAYNFPIALLKNRNLSVLENIVLYLKDTHNLTYHEIAIMLNRNDRTIWTVYKRAKVKLGK